MYVLKERLVAEATKNEEETPPHEDVEVGDSRAQVGMGTSGCPLGAPPTETLIKEIVKQGEGNYPKWWHAFGFNSIEEPNTNS